MSGVRKPQCEIPSEASAKTCVYVFVERHPGSGAAEPRFMGFVGGLQQEPGFVYAAAEEPRFLWFIAGLHSEPRFVDVAAEEIFLIFILIDIGSPSH